MNNSITRFGLLFFAFVAIVSCKKEEKVDYTQIDEDIIAQYVADSSLVATATSSGLYYVINQSGFGMQAREGATVTVAYKGYLTDGTVFDESTSAGITFSLDNVIKGWQEGIPLFSEGGSGTLLIPSALGYGGTEKAGIPANSVLIFEISLIEVES